jgi:hypothetical protein
MGNPNKNENKKKYFGQIREIQIKKFSYRFSVT